MTEPAPKDPVAGRELGEARWPMAAAVVTVIVVTLLIPTPARITNSGLHYVLPVLEAILLVALILGDPGRIDRRSAALQRGSTALVLLMVIGAMVQTAALTADLIRGGAVTNSADTLLEAGGIVWVVNNISFGLLYWQLDAGGAAARAHRIRRYADFAFPQQLSPEIAPPGWTPQFVDYLYIGFTNAVAFSPTDVMPLTPRAKLLMLVQSMVSLLLLGLVIARAVNVFPT